MVGCGRGDRGRILLQIPGHEEAAMDHGATVQGGIPADMADVEGTIRTVALDVTGMT